MPASISKRIYYSGRVQGVGFRYSVKQIAAGFEVVGWIRNLPDGRVEMEAGGEQRELIDFLEAINRSHLAAHIRESEHVEVESPMNRVKGFEIRS